jgi:hypothetical protein
MVVVSYTAAPPLSFLHLPHYFHQNLAPGQGESDGAQWVNKLWINQRLSFSFTGLMMLEDTNIFYDKITMYYISINIS